MRFLADMGVSTGVVEWLRNQGHDAKHLREEGLHRMPNGEIVKIRCVIYLPLWSCVTMFAAPE